MMNFRFYTLDVFTDRPFGGNPLAVFPDARGMEGSLMQRIARELNLSETVFVFPPETAAGTRRVRIFTPAAELPFAGHPTIGTAVLLALIGEVPLSAGEASIVLEENAGPVAVTIRSAEGKALSAELTPPAPPQLGGVELPPRDDIALMISLDPGELLPEPWSPIVISCGSPFLAIPVRNRDAVARARLDSGRWERQLAGHAAQGLYLFSYEESSRTVHARMFAPALGIPEDPATGSAAAPLAALLASREPSASGKFEWRIDQGVEMGRPSELLITAEKQDGKVVSIRVGGSAVLMSEGTFLFEGEAATIPARAWTPVTGDLPSPAGAYSRAVRAGELLFLSGQVPRDLVTGELRGSDIEDQTRTVLDNIRTLLELSGATLSDLVSITVYLQNIEDWSRFDAVYRSMMQPPYPTRTTVGASLHGFLVEISAIARVTE